MSSSWSFQAVCSLVRHVMYDIGIGPFFFYQVRVRVNEYIIRLIPDTSITTGASLILTALGTHRDLSFLLEFMALYQNIIAAIDF